MRVARAAMLLCAATVVDASLEGCSGGGGVPVNLSVELVVEHCPLVRSWTAAPLQASAPDVTIDVAVTADEGAGVDEGLDAGDTALQFMWTATAGTFSDTASPTSVYRCSAPGPQILTA